MPDPAVIVPQLLAAAGITPSDEEVATLIASYPTLRATVDRLHAVGEARYEEPGVIFDPIVS